MTDGKNVFDQTINNDFKTYENNRKLKKKEEKHLKKLQLIKEMITELAA